MFIVTSLLLSLLLILASATNPSRRPISPRVAARHLPPAASPSQLPSTVTEEWFQQYIDHYNFMGEDSAATFPQRYLIDASMWGGPTSPIFVYAGNEGDITLFYENSGFMLTAAAEFNALVVFIEHRYYGQSLPFGNASYSTLDNLRYLSIEQALADYTAVMRSLLGNLSAPDAPVIAWGGSYGGQLAAWWRMKYPHTIAGAIAASAPILQIPGLMDPTAYNHVITQTFATGNQQAPLAIYLAFQAMQNLSATGPGRAMIASTLNICGSLDSPGDVWNVIYYLSSAIGFMAMADYPYPANFLGPLPAYPAAVAGTFFPTSDPTNAPISVLLQGMEGIANLFYNYTGQVGGAGSCFNTTNIDPPGLDGDGWGVQCCREVVQPIGSYGWPSDMFWYSPFNVTSFIQGCQQQFGGTTPRPFLMLEEYGGVDFSGYSNLFFSNGALDPWKSGGIVSNGTAPEENDVIAYVIEGGAHHLDLRPPNPLDPDSVIIARNMERAAIRRWITAQQLRVKGKAAYAIKKAV